MLIKIGETQWIKAKKINALKTCQRGIKKQWDVCVYTDRETCVYGSKHCENPHTAAFYKGVKKNYV